MALQNRLYIVFISSLYRLYIVFISSLYHLYIAPPVGGGSAVLLGPYYSVCHHRLTRAWTEASLARKRDKIVWGAISWAYHKSPPPWTCNLAIATSLHLFIFISLQDVAPPVGGRCLGFARRAALARSRAVLGAVAPLKRRCAGSLGVCWPSSSSPRECLLAPPLLCSQNAKTAILEGA